MTVSAGGSLRLEDAEVVCSIGATAGVQAETVGGRPVYVMPSTSGLNARSTPADLAGHLAAAWALSDGRGPDPRRR